MREKHPWFRVKLLIKTRMVPIILHAYPHNSLHLSTILSCPGHEDPFDAFMF